ncbi:MAG: sulfurtransferase TusA family protein [Sporichthyaceae bacterium]
MEPALVLDVLGRRCPAPIIELAKHIRDVEIGQVVGVLADDPAAALDIPAWCEMRGQEYLGHPGEPYLVRRLS